MRSPLLLIYRYDADGIYHPGLDHELMTGISENAGPMESLSKITIGMLHDLGYQVNYEMADDFVL